MFESRKYALLAFQCVGLLASAFLVGVTYLNSDQVEARVQSFAIMKVEAAADAAWVHASNAVQNGTRAEKLGALANKLGFRAEAIDQKRKEIIPALVAYALSDRCGDNCGFAAFTGLVANSVMLGRIAKLRVGQSTLGDFIVERYETTVRGLVLDLRRFGLVNLVALTLASALILFKNVLNWRFAALSVSITGYATWAAYGYIYKQDWARTILLQNWAAGGYQAAMIFVCCLFFDWLFLRGMVTQTVANAIATAFPN